MFPIRDDNPTLSTAWATFLIISLNVASWIWLQGLGMEPTLAMSVCKYGAIPGELLGTVHPGMVVPLGPGISCVVRTSRGCISGFTPRNRFRKYPGIADQISHRATRITEILGL